MSKVKIEGHGTGTGTFTVTTPSSNTDRTITLPDSTGTLATTTDVSARLPSITDNGDATAITINSSEKVGIGIADAHHMLHIKENSTSNSLASGVKVQITNEQGAGNFATLRFTGSNQNGFIGYRDGANDQDRRISIGIGADAEHISFSQAGIKFNGDTAEANGLDDYEEGYYTVSISGSTSGNFNMAGNDTLAYTKIGRLVTIQGYIGAQSGSVGGNVRMSLPFAPTNLGIDDQTYNFPSVMLQNQGHTIAGQKYLFLQADGSAYLYRVTDAGSANYISNGDVDGNFEIGVSFTYISG